MLDHAVLSRSASQLQPLPPSLARLGAVLARDPTDLDEVVKIVAYDPPLALKLLRLANSAFSGSSYRIGTVQEAARRVGTEGVFGLVLGSCARPLLEQPLAPYGLPTGELWRHSVTAAITAEAARQVSLVEIPASAYTAALLHDIGKLILAPFLTVDRQALLRLATIEGGLEFFQAETELLSVHHGDVGGLVAQHWGLPEEVVRGVIHHHEPKEQGGVVSYLTCLANVVAHRVGGKGDPPVGPPCLPDVLDRLKISQADLDRLCGTVVNRLQEVLEAYG
jgi:putative nucleotidyltransferase with HDIG domain